MKKGEKEERGESQNGALVKKDKSKQEKKEEKELFVEKRKGSKTRKQKRS